MGFLEFLGIIYLVFGLFYALFILFRGADKWYVFPINALGGPVMLVYIVVTVLRGRRLPM